MNGSFGFNVISEGQQCNPFVQPAGYQTHPANQNAHLMSNVGIQNLPQVTENLILNSQLQASTGITFMNQNGATFCAITPNQLQPQCFQAIETPQGLQLFQVISTPSIQSSHVENINPLSIHNVNQAQVFPGPVQLQEVSTFHQSEPHQIQQNYVESEITEQTAQNDENCFEGQKSESSEDPLSALSSLTSSVNQNFESNQSLPLPYDQMNCQAVSPNPGNAGVVQPYMPGAQSFQILVNTPQGMAIQTILASYPAPVMPLIASNCISNPNIAVGFAATNVPVGDKDMCAPQQAQSSSIAIKPVVSPHHELVPVGVNECRPVAESSVVVSNEMTASSAPLVSLPVPSPHCLPDSTEDLCQATIKQSTSSIVDGINLEDIREFARSFKMRRLVLGLTQTQVGQALSATEGPAYSQSAICRFEKLDITPRSAMKIRPVLENWLKEAEEKERNARKEQQQHTTGVDYVGAIGSGIGSVTSKIRKRRTFFSAEALVVLNAHFDTNSHPSSREISAIAYEIGYERDVVRVWFCNKRQSLRHFQTFQNHRGVDVKSSAHSNSTGSPQPSSSTTSSTIA